MPGTSFRRNSAVPAVLLLGLTVFMAPAGRSQLRDLSTLFLSIILEALPFITAGVLISSFIQVYISPAALRRMLPRSVVPALVLAALAGLVFPVCECGIIPVARRLLEKGTPLPVAITFMLAVPSINPVVLASTGAAFQSAEWVVLRASLAFIIALGTGLLLHRLQLGNQVLKVVEHRHPDCCCGHHPGGALKRPFEVLAHAHADFLQVTRYLVAGAFLAALFQTVLPRDILLAVGKNPVAASAALMSLAYGISLCSEADAFVAATFLDFFPGGSILAFLILGPMLDLKNTFLLCAVFRKGLVLLLAAVVVLSVLLASLAVNLFFEEVL